MGVGDCWAGEVSGGSTYRYKHGFAFGNIKAKVVYRYPFHNGVYVILELFITRLWITTVDFTSLRMRVVR